MKLKLTYTSCSRLIRNFQKQLNPLLHLTIHLLHTIQHMEHWILRNHPNTLKYSLKGRVKHIVQNQEGTQSAQFASSMWMWNESGPPLCLAVTEYVNHVRKQYQRHQEGPAATLVRSVEKVSNNIWFWKEFMTSKKLKLRASLWYE